jgi:hypothetical protein
MRAPVHLNAPEPSSTRTGRRTLHLDAVAVALAAVDAPRSTRAAESPEWGTLGVDEDALRLELSAGWACWGDTRRYHGVGSALHVAWQFSPFWHVGGRAAVGRHVSKGEAFSVTQVAPVLRLQLDVVEFVPWLEVAPGLYLLHGEHVESGARGGLATGFGLEMLLNPSWSLGFSAHLHQISDEDRYPAWMEVGATLGWRTVLGNPLAP